MFLITFRFALVFWFGTWRKKGAAKQKETVENSALPTRAHRMTMHESPIIVTLKRLKNCLMICGTRKRTFWLTLFLVEPSQLFIGQRLSNYHSHIVPEHLPTKPQVRATSLLQARSPRNHPRKLLSSLSRFIIHCPPGSLSRRIQGFLEEIKALTFLQNKWNGTCNIRKASGKRGLQPSERLSKAPRLASSSHWRVCSPFRSPYREPVRRNIKKRNLNFKREGKEERSFAGIF